MAGLICLTPSCLQRGTGGDRDLCRWGSGVVVGGGGGGGGGAGSVLLPPSRLTARPHRLTPGFDGLVTPLCAE